MRGSGECGADIPVCRWGAVLDWASGKRGRWDDGGGSRMVLSEGNWGKVSS